VTFAYAPDRPAAVADVELTLAPGEVVAVVGGNGSGKSTLARLANGLLQPQAGEVRVTGLSTADPERLWDVRARVGLLFQDPEDQIVGATVEDDVAFGLENLGVPRPQMRERVAAVLAAVGLTEEAGTEPHLLSGGQKQRLALAGVLVLEPSVLVLDEPTSMLDPRGREEVLQAVAGLAARGVAVLLITQHMEETLAADRLVALDQGRIAFSGPPGQFFRSGAYQGFPLGRPRPLELAAQLAGRLAAEPGGGAGDAPATAGPGGAASLAHALRAAAPLDEEELAAALALGIGAGPAPTAESSSVETAPVAEGRAQGAPPAVVLDQVELCYNRGLPFARQALSGAGADIPAEAVTAVVGATAAGKTSLLQVAAGLLRADAGAVTVFGTARPRPGEVGMVFQRPEGQLFAGTVGEDVAVAPRMHGVPVINLQDRVRWALATVGLDPEAFSERAPHSLSVGEQRRVAIAGILSLRPRLLVLDEPGSGLDPAGRRQLMARLVTWARDEHRTLLFTSHDLDECAELADWVLVMAEGRVIAQGPSAEVLGGLSVLSRAGLRPPLAARVAARLGAGTTGLPVDAAGLATWIARRPPAAPASSGASAGAEPGAAGTGRPPEGLG